MTAVRISDNNSLIDGYRPTKNRNCESLNFASRDVFVDPGPSPTGNTGPYLHVPSKEGDTVHRVYWRPIKSKYIRRLDCYSGRWYWVIEDE